MKENQFWSNKGSGFYVGLAGALLALITLFVYIGMNSDYFTWLVVLGLVAGIAAFLVAEVLRQPIGIVLSYVCYLFAFYHFLVLEVEFRMDTIVDPAQGVGALDAIFFIAVAFFLLSVITTIVSSCMKQEKTE